MKVRRFGTALALLAVAAGLLSAVTPTAFAIDDVVESKTSSIVTQHTPAHLVAGSRPQLNTRAASTTSHRYAVAASVSVACLVAAGALIASRRHRPIAGVVIRPALGRAPPLRLI